MRTSPKALDAFRRLVSERCDALRALSYEQLLAPERRTTEHVIVEKRRATVSTIVEPKGERLLRVVVQGFMPTRIRVGASVALDGFYKRADGVVEPMPEQEFHEFD